MATKNCLEVVMRAANVNEDEAADILETASQFVESDIGDEAITAAKSWEAFQEGKWKAIQDRKIAQKLKERAKLANELAVKRGTEEALFFIRQARKANKLKTPTPEDYQRAIETQIAASNIDGEKTGVGYSAENIIKSVFTEEVTALKRSWQNEVGGEILEQLGGLTNAKASGKAVLYGQAGDIDFIHDFIRAAFGETVGDARAAKAAHIYNAHSWQLGSRVNRNGGVIPLMKNRVPQVYDKSAIAADGVDKVAEFIVDGDLLDPFTFDKSGNTKRKVPSRDKQIELVKEMLTNIVHGKRQNTPNLDQHFRPTGSPAAGFEQSRQIYWKNADAFIKFNEAYGTPDILSSIVGEIRERSTAIGLMKKFGTNPRQSIRNIIDNVVQSAIDDPRISTQESFDIGEQLGTKEEGKIWQLFDVVSGVTDQVTDVKAAERWKFVRDIQNLAKLGSAGLAALADGGNYAAAYRQHTGEFTGWFDYLKSIKTNYTEGEYKELVELCGDFFDGITTYNPHRLDAASDFGTGKMGTAVDLMFRMNGLNHLTESTKAGFARMIMRHAGNNAEKSFDDLFIGTQRIYKEFGITSKEWDVVRNAKVDIGGNTYVAPEQIKQLDDSLFEDFIDPKYSLENKPTEGNIEAWDRVRSDLISSAREEMELKFRSMIMEETRRAIIEPNARTKRVVTGFGAKRGSQVGEAFRVLTQFKTFSIAFFQAKGRARNAYRLLGIVPGASLGSNVAGIASAATWYTTFGYLSGAMKDIAAGKEPKDVTKPLTWVDAASRSGMLSAYGDFLFNAGKRYGLYEIAGGPTLGSAVELGQAVGTTINDLWKGKTPKRGMKKAFNLVTGHAPILNWMMVRPIFNYGVGYNVNEFFDPGSTRRHERRVKKDYGQEYFFQPSKYRSGKLLK